MTQAEKFLQSRIRELNYMDTVIKPDKVVSLEHAQIAVKIAVLEEQKDWYRGEDKKAIEYEIETLMKS